MISLVRSETPADLSHAKAVEMTDRYLISGEPVWNTDVIRGSLLLDTHNKCAYCEAKLVEESKYLEVDHFRCKRDFSQLVVIWSNLVASCKRCNVNKSSHNVDIDGMLVNPYEMSPHDHIYIQNYRLRWRDDIGKNTIEALYLNDSDRMVMVRALVGNAIISSLDDIRQRMEDYIGGDRTTRKRNSIVRGIEALLRQATPEAEYSATTATVLLADPDYVWIRDHLVALELWGQLEILERRAAGCALPA